MRNAQQRGALCAHGELRNCHFSGNFVTETAHYLGAVESKRHNAVTPFATGFIAGSRISF